jgi:hypothetical protein
VFRIAWAADDDAVTLDGVGYTVMYSVVYTHSIEGSLDVLTMVPTGILTVEFTDVPVAAVPCSLK